MLDYVTFFCSNIPAFKVERSVRRKTTARDCTELFRSGLQRLTHTCQFGGTKFFKSEKCRFWHFFKHLNARTQVNQQQSNFASCYLSASRPYFVENLANVDFRKIAILRFYGHHLLKWSFLTLFEPLAASFQPKFQTRSWLTTSFLAVVLIADKLLDLRNLIIFSRYYKNHQQCQNAISSILTSNWKFAGQQIWTF